MTQQFNPLAVILGALGLFLAQCSSTSSSVFIGVADKAPEIQSSPATQSDLVEFTHTSLAALGQSVSVDSVRIAWEEERYGRILQNTDSFPSPGTIGIALEVFRRFGYHPLTLSPCSYQALRALSYLPVLPLAINLHFDGKSIHPLEDPENLSFASAVATDLGPHLYVEPLVQYFDSKTSCAVELSGTTRISGTCTDDIAGAIFPLKDTESDHPYGQVLQVVVLTSLSAFELQANLDEWYGRLPYNPQAPTVSSLSLR